MRAVPASCVVIPPASATAIRSGPTTHDPASNPHDPASTRAPSSPHLPDPTPARHRRRRRPASFTDGGASINRPAASPSPAVRFRRSARRDDDVEFTCGGGGGMVDEGMVVLRRRIHEMRAAERNWEPPEEWAAWEKEWYATYDADVCGLVGLLQAFLVGSRPGVGVGLLAVLALAVPASAFVIVSHLLDASRAIISGLHHH